MIGHIINNYVIERELGDGGMGTVYFARHNRVDREVAIKVLHSNLFSNEGIRNRFKNEANALIKLSHPRIVKIYDYVEQDNLACLIMEYIHGYTLDDYISKVTGPLTATKAITIISGVLDAVQYAHDNKIYHRDIKPGNIMVSHDGNTVKIMDFGIAKLATDVNMKATQANAQLGTPFYMSPEQVKGLPFTWLSDIYALGVTLFEMVTGKCPYQEITNLFELQTKIVQEPFPSTYLYYPDVPKRIQEAIIKATNKDPAQRFQSCNEFKSFLEEKESLRTTNVKATAPPTPPPPAIKKTEPAIVPPTESKQSKTKIYLAIGVVVLVLGIVIAFVFVGSGSKGNSINNEPKDSTKTEMPATADTTKKAGSETPAAKDKDSTTKITSNTGSNGGKMDEEVGKIKKGDNKTCAMPKSDNIKLWLYHNYKPNNEDIGGLNLIDITDIIEEKELGHFVVKFSVKDNLGEKGPATYSQKLKLDNDCNINFDNGK